jgi:murein DD-endopeptidase MepM/ murein hydrolase activator NlpD
MQIILVPTSLGGKKTIALNGGQSLTLLGLFVVVPVLLASLLYYFTLTHGLAIRIPYVQALVLNAQQREAEMNRSYLHENLNALSVKLGQMQAQLVRLDALGARLAQSTGVKAEEFRFGQLPGRGGAESSPPSRELSLGEFKRQLAALSGSLGDRSDKLSAMELVLQQDSLKKRAIPSLAPVSVGWHSSNYGWRIDPFTGHQAFHEGVDFMSAVGTPVMAAASGVVVYSAYHPQYGNMVEIDHGNGLVSRYAHASALLVKVGEAVLKGQRIALVGSTGRSTGAHLHFEVRQNGAPQNPERFLKLAG